MKIRIGVVQSSKSQKIPYHARSICGKMEKAVAATI